MEVLRSDHQIEFIVHDTDKVKGLRDYIMTKIPCMAISLVDIWTNESSYPDADLAQMLFMVPIEACPDDFDMPGHPTDDGICIKGCERCEAIFDLDITCPFGSYTDITNLDLKKLDGSCLANVVELFVDGEQAPLPVGKLSAPKLRNCDPYETSVKIICHARFGYGTDHARWRYCTTVVCLPHRDGTLFRFKMNGQLSSGWLLAKVDQYLSRE